MININEKKMKHIESGEIKSVKFETIKESGVTSECLIINLKNNDSYMLVPREDCYSGGGGWFDIKYNMDRDEMTEGLTTLGRAGSNKKDYSFFRFSKDIFKKQLKEELDGYQNTSLQECD